MFEYRARNLRVVDGDTIDLMVDLGFYIYTQKRVRLIGINTAEIHNTSRDSDEYQRGIIHKQFVDEWMNDAQTGEEWPLIVRTYDYDSKGKYGRWVADIIRISDGRILSEDIVAAFPDVVSE